MRKGYWIICVKDYEVDGHEFTKGIMRWHPKGARPLINGLWRKATNEEIETKERFKGEFFNLINF